MFKETVSLDIFEIAAQGKKGLVGFIRRETRFPEGEETVYWKITGHEIGRVEITVRDAEQMIADGDLMG